MVFDIYLKSLPPRIKCFVLVLFYRNFFSDTIWFQIKYTYTRILYIIKKKKQFKNLIHMCVIKYLKNYNLNI